ncbi:MAG: enoyl-CoA hydratase, partial [Hyphomicrobiales bacterium]|nr:enoyl-CoA hydratase [Hyphomicrobiales bacterium]
ARASELLLLAEAFDAETARELGLVNALVPESTLLAHAMSKAAALVAKPRSALLTTRRLMRGDAAALKARMEEEIEAFAAALGSGEARAAFKAFMSGARS